MVLDDIQIKDRIIWEDGARASFDRIANNRVIKDVFKIINDEKRGFRIEVEIKGKSDLNNAIEYRTVKFN